MTHVTHQKMVTHLTHDTFPSLYWWVMNVYTERKLRLERQRASGPQVIITNDTVTTSSLSGLYLLVVISQQESRAVLSQGNRAIPLEISIDA